MSESSASILHRDAKAINLVLHMENPQDVEKYLTIGSNKHFVHSDIEVPSRNHLDLVSIFIIL